MQATGKGLMSPWPVPCSKAAYPVCWLVYLQHSQTSPLWLASPDAAFACMVGLHVDRHMEEAAWKIHMGQFLA